MKKIILAVAFSATLVTALQAQFLKKLANKVNQAIDKKVDKTIDSTFNKSTNGSKTNTDNNSQATNKTNVESTAQTGAKTDNSNPTVYSKFDFVPGTTILYYDNFEKLSHLDAFFTFCLSHLRKPAIKNTSTFLLRNTNIIFLGLFYSN